MGMSTLFHGKHHEHCPPHLGDCAEKKDGEACTVTRPGQCVSAGKCPMFHGEMVCYPIESHAPKFVTEPCHGKHEGDACKMWLSTGKCVRPVPLAEMFCKMDWGFHEKPETVLTV